MAQSFLRHQPALLLSSRIDIPMDRSSLVAANIQWQRWRWVAGMHKVRSASKGDEFPNKSALEEFLLHGVKYAFPPERGELTRGVPTAHAAEPLRSLISAGSDAPPVWPFPEGKTRGYSFAPLYKTVPKAALRDKYLYELLALVDAIRDGKSRERLLAEKELKLRLESPRHAEIEH
jgi:hypothetical protein